MNCSIPKYIYEEEVLVISCACLCLNFLRPPAEKSSSTCSGGCPAELSSAHRFNTYRYRASSAPLWQRAQRRQAGHDEEQTGLFSLPCTVGFFYQTLPFMPVPDVLATAPPPHLPWNTAESFQPPRCPRILFSELSSPPHPVVLPSSFRGQWIGLVLRIGKESGPLFKYWQSSTVCDLGQ